MTLYQFVEMVVDAMGGMVIPLEYALCTALIPDAYKDYFQGKTELLLAFDYEVAEENPESEFVTYGGFIFDTIMQISRSASLATQRYAQVDKLEINLSADKIKKHLQMESGIVEVLSEAPKVGLWCLFNFCVQYISDERYEETQEIWMNLTNGKIDKEIITSNIFYDTQQFVNMEYIKPVSMRSAYKTAYSELAGLSSQKNASSENETQLNREINRITNYYNEMISENKKRISRKGITEERINEIRQKGFALELEKNRQIHEMQDKFALKTIILLENAIMYHIPLIEIIVRVSFHREVYKAVFYYDTIFKRMIDGGRI